MLEIDGSYGEGGGQVLRTALALSAIKGIPVKISNIRANRPKPGLKVQHLNAVRAAAAICNAEMKGDEIGSREIEFSPGKIRGGEVKVEIGTAGSITLVLQTLMPIAAFVPERVVIDVRGGTDVAWSPPVDYVGEVLLPMLGKMGYRAVLEILRRGYYPVGGGRVKLMVEPSELKAVDFVEKGKLLAVKGISYAAKELEQAQVADRQAKAARTLLWNNFQITPEIAVQYAETDCPGSGILLWLEYENAVLGGSALGERGKRSETVGSEAANALIRQKAVVDEHIGDQLLPYLAVSGGKFRYNALLTGHLLTNLHIINKVLGTDIKAIGGEGLVGEVALK